LEHFAGKVDTGFPSEDATDNGLSGKPASVARMSDAISRIVTFTMAMRVNVTLPSDVLEQIDRYVEAHGLSRSGFLAQATNKAIVEAA
jgi:hypothetical protein